MNKLINAINNTTTTENGHYAVKSTGNALLNLYGIVGGLRHADFTERVQPLLDDAINEDKQLATRLMFYTRDAREGVGERELFRKMIRYVAYHYPELLKNNIHLIPFYGRWDDMYALVDTPLEKQMWDIMRTQWHVDFSDMEQYAPISLLGKWVKSVNASSPETCALGRKTAAAFGLSERNYRKAVARLRNYLDVVEVNMSAKDWELIDYEKVPSRAMLKYREAFGRNDAERYETYLNKVREGEAKINTKANTPQDLIHAMAPNVFGACRFNDTIELLWKNLPNYINSNENIMVMADVSGSMQGRPMEVSIGLAIYFAEHNTGDFHNTFMTFSYSPTFVHLRDDESLAEKIREVQCADWGCNTDLNRACLELVKFARAHNVPTQDMPTRLIIISDMEIDEADDMYATHSEETRRYFERYGYTMPQLIYWNVDSRQNAFQATADQSGVMLASGSSPAVFQALLEMKDYSITPYESMLEVLNSPRYQAIRV